MKYSDNAGVLFPIYGCKKTEKGAMGSKPKSVQRRSKSIPEIEGTATEVQWQNQGKEEKDTSTKRWSKRMA